jgi:serine protease Do
VCSLRGVLAAGALLATVALTGCGTVVPSTRLPATFSHTLNRAVHGVVGVYGTEVSTTQAGEATLTEGTVGAGFFIDDAGTIVTAAHVTSQAARIIVRLSDQRIFEAQRIAEDRELDIAIIRIEAPDVRPPPLGRASSLRAGDWVLAVGEPYGLRRSVVAGIVSGGPRHFSEDLEGLFIQTNIALNPGNSGGPLLDLSGAVVGMNVRTVVGVQGGGGVSLSIPIEVVQQIARENQSDALDRPRLGARFEDVSPPAAAAAGRKTTTGAVVREVTADSLALRAGFEEGDILVGMNDRPITDSGDLARQLFAWRHASGTRFVVFRRGHFQSVVIPETP